jgi:hypothetical protein
VTPYLKAPPAVNPDARGRYCLPRIQYFNHPTYLAPHRVFGVPASATHPGVSRRALPRIRHALPSTMKPILLITGGVIQILITLLHVGLFFGISASAELSPNAKISSYIFNAAVTAVVLFFAYVSFFHRRDLIETRLGRALGFFIAVFYLQRGLVEVFLRGSAPLNLGLSLAIAALYVTAVWPSPRTNSARP